MSMYRSERSASFTAVVHVRLKKHSSEEIRTLCKLEQPRKNLGTQGDLSGDQRRIFENTPGIGQRRVREQAQREHRIEHVLGADGQICTGVTIGVEGEVGQRADGPSRVGQPTRTNRMQRWIDGHERSVWDRDLLARALQSARVLAVELVEGGQ